MKKTNKTKCDCWRGLPFLLIAIGLLFSSWQPVYGQVCASDDPTSPGNITPEFVSGNPECTGTTYRVKFDPPQSGTHNLPGGGTITMTLSSSPCGQVLNWVASEGVEVYQIVVKGGPNANLYNYPEAIPYDNNLHSPLGPNRRYYGISHIDFCYEFVPPPQCEAEASNDVTCFGGDDGELTVTWTGGVGPFRIYLNGMLYASNVTSPYVIGGLTAGIYSCKIVDSRDIETICGAEIEGPEFAVEADWEGKILCYGQTAEITITVTGGSPPYELSGGDEIIPPSDDGIVSLSLGKGSTQIIVTDNDGCTDTLNIVLEEPPPLEADWDGEILCNDDLIDVTVTPSGGTPPYKLFDGATEVGDFTDDTFVVEDVGAGEYFWTVVDANDCEAELDFTLEQPDELLADWDADEILCYGDLVDVTVTVTGGTEPIKLFDGDDEVGTFVAGEFIVPDLPAGDYLWTVIDANDCVDIVEFTLEQPDELMCEIVDFTTSECEADNGTATVEAYGGTLPYTYLWSDGQTTAIATGLAPGFYEVTVTDANGCETTCYVTIEEEPCIIYCETAYGMGDGAVCFTGDGFRNWGWTNEIHEEGVYTMPLYAGAAHCNPENGWGQVGIVEVNYSDGSLTVTYTMDPGYSLSEIHVYVGCGKYPKLPNGRETIAPGQYTKNAMLDRAESYTVTFTGMSGPVWIIAHSVVCDISGRDIVDGGSMHLAIECVEGTQLTQQGSPRRGRPKVEVFPNPFRNSTKISISVENDAHAVVEVYTLQGARVAVLFDEPISAKDVHTVTFTPDIYTSRQIYLVVVRTDYGQVTRQILTY